MQKLIHTYISVVIVFSYLNFSALACKEESKEQSNQGSKPLSFQILDQNAPLEIRYKILSYLTDPEDLRTLAWLNSAYKEFINNYIYGELAQKFKNPSTAIHKYLHSLFEVSPEDRWWIRLEFQLLQPSLKSLQKDNDRNKLVYTKQSIRYLKAYYKSDRSKYINSHPYAQAIFIKAELLLKYSILNEEASYQLVRLYTYGRYLSLEFYPNDLEDLINKLCFRSDIIKSKTILFSWKHKLPYEYKKVKDIEKEKKHLRNLIFIIYKLEETNLVETQDKLSSDQGTDVTKEYRKEMYKLGKSKFKSFKPSSFTTKGPFSDLEEAAKMGEAKAQNLLGILYYHRHGNPEFTRDKQASLAIHWIGHAAIQGNYNAQFNLSVLYSKSGGVLKNLAQSFYWYKKCIFTLLKDRQIDKYVGNPKLIIKNAYEWEEADISTSIKSKRLAVKKPANESELGPYDTRAPYIKGDPFSEIIFPESLLNLDTILSFDLLKEEDTYTQFKIHLPWWKNNFFKINIMHSEPKDKCKTQ